MNGDGLIGIALWPIICKVVEWSAYVILSPFFLLIWFVNLFERGETMDDLYGKDWCKGGAED